MQDLKIFFFRETETILTWIFLFQSNIKFSWSTDSAFISVQRATIEINASWKDSF